MCSEIVSHEGKAGLLLRKNEFNELSELRYAIDGFYQLLERSSGVKSDIGEIAAVLNPINTLLFDFVEKLEQRQPRALWLEEGGAR